LVVGNCLLFIYFFLIYVSSAGAGVPRGYRIDSSDFPGPVIEDHELRPLVRVGASDHIAFVGDLPYPNAELNGITTIADLAGGGAFDELYLTSELTPCVPQSSGAGSYSCPNETRALVPGPAAGGVFPVTDRCTQAAGAGKRLCPWGMNKWQGNPVQLVLGGVDGSWYERQWDFASTASNGPYFGINLTGGRPSGTSFVAGPSGLKNPDLVGRPAGAALFSSNGGGFVSNVDRVFWSFEKKGAPGAACPGPNQGCVLLRRQCWGPLVDPGNGNFPGVTASAYRSDKTPTNCAAPANGTNWETVMTGVDSFVLSYFDDAGAPITAAWDLGTAVDVESIGVDLVLSRKIAGTTAVSTYRSSQRFFINNNGGLVSLPPPPGAPPPPPPAHNHGGCGHHHCGQHGHGDHG
jgi:hypothetical protein